MHMFNGGEQILDLGGEATTQPLKGGPLEYMGRVRVQHYPLSSTNPLKLCSPPRTAPTIAIKTLNWICRSYLDTLKKSS